MTENKLDDELKKFGFMGAGRSPRGKISCPAHLWYIPSDSHLISHFLYYSNRLHCYFFSINSCYYFIQNCINISLSNAWKIIFSFIIVEIQLFRIDTCPAVSYVPKFRDAPYVLRKPRLFNFQIGPILLTNFLRIVLLLHSA